MHRQSEPKIGWVSAGAIVIANIVGTGVFTSLGLQLQSIQNTWSILILWILGGLISLFGAFSYAELGTHLPKSGGEYHFLSEIYHPFLGYLSGWVSLTVGFAAPIALAAMAMGAYMDKFLPVSAELIAVLSILLLSVVHSMSIRQSSRFQNLFTLLKILLIAGMVLAAFLVPSQANALDFSDTWKLELVSPAFAIALVYVTYSYSGWNAAAYIIEEIKNPKINLPKALIGGTSLVCILYVLLQYGFLRQAPLDALAGKVEIGQVVAEYMFGWEGSRGVSFLISLLLISSISAMVWVGPRITRAMANDYRLWQFLATDNKHGIPVRAIWFQTFISVLLIITGSFEQVFLYSGFILQVFTTFTIAGVILLRIRLRGTGQGYKSPGYPILQIVYLLVSAWILIYLLYDKPQESLLGFVNLLLGALTFWMNGQLHQKE
ncbi:MAG: amino acid permease [Phaeodactylibacter sp.]|nr:amino acid permease [Phaeodactylibacter sp.]